MTSYTSYLIEGHFTSGSGFSTRKRFSDFEWLRSTFVANYPGASIPQLPPKSVQNRLNEAFIEARRVKLDAFLQNLFAKPYFQDNTILKAWLNCPESGMEAFKKDMSNKPRTDIAADYKRLFEDIIKFAPTMGTPESLVQDAARMCRFVNGHYDAVTHMGQHLHTLLKARIQEKDSLLKLSERMVDMAQAEKFCQREFASMKIPWRPRIADSIKTVGEHADAAKHGGWENLARALQLESQEMQSLADGVRSLMNLEKEAAIKEHSLAKVEAILNGAKEKTKDKLVGKVSSFFGGKTEDPAVTKQRLTDELAVLTSWIADARIVLLTMQSQETLRTMVVRFRELTLNLARRRAQLLKEESNIWDQFASVMENDDGTNPPFSGDDEGMGGNDNLLSSADLDVGLASLDDVNAKQPGVISNLDDDEQIAESGDQNNRGGFDFEDM